MRILNISLNFGEFTDFDLELNGVKKIVAKTEVCSYSFKLSVIHDDSLKIDVIEAAKNVYKCLEDILFRMGSTYSEKEKNQHLKYLNSALLVFELLPCMFEIVDNIDPISFISDY